MKRVKQVEESKGLIVDALFKLLKQYELGDITISQITAEAGVGRNTFYRNFESKEEIFKYSLEQALNEAKGALELIRSPKPKDFVLWRFRFLKENPEFAVFKKRSELFAIFNQFREYNKSRNVLGFNYKEKPKYLQEFNIGGLDSVTARWIEGGMKESPEEMLKILKKIFRR